MKDYASMSDFEINSAVHNPLLSEPYSMLFMGNDRIEWTSKDGRKVITDKVPYTKNGVHDYCNNPADAWPILLWNKITISAPLPQHEYWTAEKRDTDGEVLDFYVGTNPLRSAMIVFLMMKESEND